MGMFLEHVVLSYPFGSLVPLGWKTCVSRGLVPSRALYVYILFTSVYVCQKPFLPQNGFRKRLKLIPCDIELGEGNRPRTRACPVSEDEKGQAEKLSWKMQIWTI